MGSLGDAGNATLKAKVGINGLEELSIFAFGRLYRPTKGDFERLKAFPLEGIRITHEAGYSKTGGYTIYVNLIRIYPAYKETAKIAIQRKGEMTVSIHRN